MRSTLAPRHHAPSRRLPLVLCVCASALNACGPEDAPSESVIRVDSAGIEVVTNQAVPGSLPRRAVGGPPRLVIESDDASGVILFQVSDVALLEGGGLAVAARGSSAVYVFDAQGALQATLGRSGEGPGEFQMVASVVPVGADSVAVYDAALDRMTLFGVDGGLGRTVDLSGLSASGGFERLHRLEAGGFAFVGVGGLGRRSDEGSFRTAASSFRLDAGGDSVAHYGEFPGHESMVAEAGGEGQVLVGPLPFGTTLSSATRSDRLVLGVDDAPELVELDGEGTVARIVRWADHDREVTDERMAEYVESMVEDTPEESRAAFRDIAESLPHAAVEPAYADLLGAHDGTLWVGDYPGPEYLLLRRPPPTRTWRLIDTTGAVRGVMETPAGFRPMAADGSRVAGVHVDELGVESIRVYELPPG